MRKNIFVIGLGPFHRRMLESIRHAGGYEFHGLLDYDEVIKPAAYDFDDLLNRAEQQLRDFSDGVDAVISHWDFPGSTLQPILCDRLGLRAATLEAVLKCEHKYWARLQQQEAIPELTPRFDAVDPFDDHALEKIEVPFPFWLKPIKGFSSLLGFRIGDRSDFEHAIERTRRGINRIGDAFNRVLEHAALPPEIERVDGNWCIAEEIVKGLQCGIEGSMFDGKYTVHGVFDCVKDARNWSFTRYEYPSVWPERIQKRMREAGEQLMRHIGYDNAAFGVEFFWDEDTDEVRILEVNTRISQSHSDQFIKVEGVSNHEVLVDVALGREPDFDRKAGSFETAAKFMLRKYGDAEVLRVPSRAEIEAVQAEFKDSIVNVTVEEGQRLSELRDEDSYSYEIASIYLGAQNQRELLQNYDRAAHRLPFEFSDGHPPEEHQFQPVRY